MPQSSPRHFLIYTDDPGQGGVAQCNHAMALALQARGDRVTVVQSYADNPLVAERQRRGIHHEWLSFDTGKDFSRPVYDGADADRIFCTQTPDLIVFSDSCPASSLAARHQALCHQIPFVMVEGFVAPDMTHHFGVGRMAEQSLDLLETQWQAVRQVVAVSQENLDLLHHTYRLPADLGKVIYNGRPDSFFEPQNPDVRARLRRELGIPATAVVGFTVARLEQVKGHRYLLEAIAHLRQTPVWDALHFVWAGDGRLRDDLAQHITEMGVGDRVHLLGQRWDIPDWFDASDFFLLPSEVEGMPLSIMESMAKGVPVMASAVSGIPEELGDTGILLPNPNDNPAATVQDLVNGITHWATDAAARSHHAQASRDRAQALFRYDRMVQETLHLLDQAVAQEKPLAPTTIPAATRAMSLVAGGFFPPQDYFSPGLHLVKPDAAFPNMVMGDRQASPWPYLRREIPHPWYVDQRHPFVGFLSRDEAHLLYNLALPFRGKRALEIGCWMGWSACHLALAGVDLDVVDPMLGEWPFYESVTQSLDSADVRDRVRLLPGYSPQAVTALAEAESRRWSLVFIDGDHETVGPLLDAIACEPLTEPDALVVFHDLASPHVAEGLEYFRRKGWKTLVYETMQIMGIAWRGTVNPVMHYPDPRVDWVLPPFLAHFKTSGSVHRPSAPPADWDLPVGDRIPRIRHYLANGHYARAFHLTVAALEDNPQSPELSALRQQILEASDHAQPLPAHLPTPMPPEADPLAALPLQTHNFMAFPDWSQPEDSVLEDLVDVLRTLFTDAEAGTTLLIYIGDTDPETADMALSTVALHLLTEEGLAADEGIEVALVPAVDEATWARLQPQLQARFPMHHEDAIANTLPTLPKPVT